MVVFFSSASILPSFAAVGTSSTPVFDGDGMFITADAEDIDELARNFDSVYVNEDGILSNPILSGDSEGRISSNNIVSYTVKQGDTLGAIAARYGISTTTLATANALKANATIKLGQILRILPVDGVLYVTDGDISLQELAKKYGLDANIIAEQNELSLDEVLPKGSEVILPGVKPEAVLLANTPAPIPVETQVAKKEVEKKTPVAAKTPAKKATPVKKDAPKVEATKQGKKLLWPTANPTITQKYHGGHPAIDICYTKGDHTTAIVAAAGGKVIKAQGGYNGGYGNMIIIDHGNGLRTLYAHMRELYVSPGQQVAAGQAIGWMGNTGRSYGRTGLHLHFEVIEGKKKLNPLSYL